MLKKTIKKLSIAFRLMILFTILTGLIYPAFMTGMAHLFFPWKANGSLIERNHEKVGSILIGQFFENPKYFWGRPSATQDFPYNAEYSSGANLGPSNPSLLSAVKAQMALFENTKNIPADLVMSSASGLDPEISEDGALFQVARIAKARKLKEEDIILLIKHIEKKRDFYLLGEPRINVLQLNLGLDSLEYQNALLGESHGRTTTQS